MSRVEAGIFAWELYDELAQRADREAHDQGTLLMGMIMSSDTSITETHRRRDSLQRAGKMRAKRDAEASLGRTFIRDADKANAFSKLSRYETTIERGLFKALHELERRQAARQGGNVPAPVALDVDVSGLPEGDQ